MNSKDGTNSWPDAAAAHERLAIVIPVYNDAVALSELLAQLQTARNRGTLIVVAAAKNDATMRLADRARFDRLVIAEKGRGNQLAAGAAATDREWLWFIHADSVLPANASELVCSALLTHAWGRFDVAFSSNRSAMRVIAAMMNWRSAVSAIVTGDQALFVRRDAYVAAGGFPRMPLMEDIAISRALRTTLRDAPNGGKPARIRTPIHTSARKWERDGVVRTVVRMGWWRFRFWLGARPETLAREYYREKT